MRFAWAPFGVVCSIAVVRSLLAQAVEPFPPIDEPLQREAFRVIASAESTERREAAEAFPTDFWSRDDDFHQLEVKRAREWAKSHRVNLGDALRAVDRGLHEHWPHDNPSPLVTTAPPCHPRPID